MKDNEIIIPELNKETIESMIYIIRGQKVMLDFELAKIYGYTTKSFNQQVKNNIEKFPERFRFQIIKEELSVFARSKNLTALNWATRNGGRTSLPYAFTEQGVYMLMTVLKGELATRQSIALIDAFKEMKDYIVENKGLMSLDAALINDKFESYDKRFENIENKLDVVMDNFIDPSTYKHYLILNGQKIEADIAYQEIYSKAKYTLYIIDDYIGLKTLQLLKACKQNIDIKIFSDNKSKNKLDSIILKDFIDDTKLSIEIKPNNNKFHDRYIVLDFNTKEEKIYHCGGSSKDAGNKISTITQISETNAYRQLISDLIKIWGGINPPQNAGNNVYLV